MSYKVNVQLCGKELNKDQVCNRCDKIVADWTTAMQEGWTLFMEWGSPDIKFWLLCSECAAKHRRGEQEAQR